MAFVEIEDTHTCREIVVFPRTYAAYKDLLTGRPVDFGAGQSRCSGRPCAQNFGRHHLDEITSYRASGEATAPSPPPQTNGHGAKPREMIKPTQLAETTALYQPPETPPVLPEELPAAEVTPPARWLHITIPRTNNLIRDKDRLRKVYELLIQNPGNDQFSFYIPDGHRKIRVDFPNQTTRDTAHLRQLLTQVLGATAVRVD